MRVRRRDFIRLTAGAAMLPSATRAQQAERVRRIGVLIPVSPDNQDFQSAVAEFVRALHSLGWTEGRTVQIDIRWAGSDPASIRGLAQELVSLGPDVIVTTGDSAIAPILETTRTVPIVFNNVTDPVGAGLVDSLTRPGGNATGF